MTHRKKNETQEEKKERFALMLKRLKRTYPGARIALQYGSNIQLLVAVMLSAQCTDKKVNEATSELFKKYKTVKDFANARPAVLELEIRQTGFYRTKARNIIAASQMIEREFGGKLPRTMKEMVRLPGVARKTANIVLGSAYGIIGGIAVDTHVRRLAQRFGVTRHNDPVKIEQDLAALTPRREWLHLTYLLIDHGREICTARNRKCAICPLSDLCPSSLARILKLGS